MEVNRYKMEVNRNNIYTVLGLYENLSYKIISEEYKIINNEEHYYIGVDAKITNTNRIVFSQTKVGLYNYKQMALENALVNIILIYNNNTNKNNTNNDNVTNMNKNNNVNNVNNNNYVNNMNCSTNNNNNNTNNVNNINNNNKNKFSSEVIKEMDDFKKANNITTDEKLLSYIQQFNPNIQSKKQLNEQTVISFLKWANKYIEK